ncbi:hypothetical protein JTB14_030572 [Gonioctena quinquepunctata]|nr:hypothetical protein JTB14_030572 [Gonioctena quinquepunctata]
MFEEKVVILDRGEYTTCAVNLHGASITSWRINNQEQVFLSRQASFSYVNYIRGGIGIIFPHFGTWDFGHHHGFARDLLWTLESGPNYTKNRDVNAFFSLKSDDYTNSMWNYQFELGYLVTLKQDTLEIRFTVTNISEHFPLEFNYMQKCMLKVTDVANCRILGLHGCRFQDRLGKPDLFLKEDRAEVSISKITDRVYKNTPRSLYLKDMGDGRVVKLSRTNLPDFNVWNPWEVHPRNETDLDDDEYKHFIATEAGVVTQKVSLNPVSCWKASQILEVFEAPLREDRLVYHSFEGYC